jgi:hypothetical protein
MIPFSCDRGGIQYPKLLDYQKDEQLSTYKYSIGDRVTAKYASGRAVQGKIVDLKSGCAEGAYSVLPDGSEHTQVFFERELTKVSQEPELTVFKKGDRVRVPENYGGFETTVAMVGPNGPRNQLVTVVQHPTQTHNVLHYSGSELTLVTEDATVSSYTTVIDNVAKEIKAERDKIREAQAKIDKLVRIQVDLIALREASRQPSA